MDFQTSNPQYVSQENMMRIKFAADFPTQDEKVFTTTFVARRERADIIFKNDSFEDRRYTAEKSTWSAFWPGQEFPGRRVLVPQSLHHGLRQPTVFRTYTSRGGRGGRIDRGGRGGRWGRGGRGGRIGQGFGGDRSWDGWQSEEERGIYLGGRGRGSSRLRALGSLYSDQNPSAFRGRNSQTVPRVFEDTSSEESQLIDFTYDGDNEDGSFVINNATSTTSQMSSLSPASGPSVAVVATETSIVLDPKINCLQCGIPGHVEVGCRYIITLKQRSDQERHLVCGTLGHSAFAFASAEGCLRCKAEKETAEQASPSVGPPPASIIEEKLKDVIKESSGRLEEANRQEAVSTVISDLKAQDLVDLETNSAGTDTTYTEAEEEQDLIVF